MSDSANVKCLPSDRETVVIETGEMKHAHDHHVLFNEDMEREALIDFYAHGLTNNMWESFMKFAAEHPGEHMYFRMVPAETITYNPPFGATLTGPHMVINAEVYYGVIYPKPDKTGIVRSLEEGKD